MKTVRFDVNITGTASRYGKRMGWNKVLVVNEHTVRECWHLHPTRVEAELCPDLDQLARDAQSQK